MRSRFSTDPRLLANRWPTSRKRSAGYRRLSAFVASAAPACAWRRAFYRFCGYVGLGEAAVRQDEWLTAQLGALALCPEPAFTVPAHLRRAPRGWFAIAGEPTMLYAALAGELVAMGRL